MALKGGGRTVGTDSGRAICGSAHHPSLDATTYRDRSQSPSWVFLDTAIDVKADVGGPSPPPSLRGGVSGSARMMLLWCDTDAALHNGSAGHITATVTAATSWGNRAAKQLCTGHAAYDAQQRSTCRQGKLLGMLLVGHAAGCITANSTATASCGQRGVRTRIFGGGGKLGSPSRRRRMCSGGAAGRGHHGRNVTLS